MANAKRRTAVAPDDDPSIDRYLDQIIAKVPAANQPAADIVCRQGCPHANWMREGHNLRCYCHSMGIYVHILDFADTQQDLATPYSEIEGVTVHAMPTGDHDAERGSVLRALVAADPGQVVIVQFPGSSIERIEMLHKFLIHAQNRATMPVDVALIWTMDSDRNSRDLLKLMLETPLPGPLHVNWPAWNGKPDIAPDLVRQIAAQGGKIFALPSLDASVHRAFKADRKAPRQFYLEGDLAQRMELDFWCANVAAAVGARW